MTGAAVPVLAGVVLEKRFGVAVALGGVDLEVGVGEAVAVMGPSGSGKSTLLHCLAGIVRPDRGEVWLDRRRIDGLGESSRSRLRRGELGFVFQSDQLLPELPAIENVALPLMLGGLSRRQAVRESAPWFGPLGFAGLEGRRPGELSGGEAQRVAIARAMAIRPTVVFADEPTAALDRATGMATIALLASACRGAGAGLLVVTHDAEVGDACDRVVQIRDGRLKGSAAAAATAGSSPDAGAGAAAGSSPGSGAAGTVGGRAAGGTGGAGGVEPVGGTR